MTVRALPDYPKRHWPAIREQLLSGTYWPQPVKRVEIDKPDGGGVRKLGVPTVLDRFIQQAVLQVLQQRWDRTFSDHSYGFRPERSAHLQAIHAGNSFLTACLRTRLTRVCSPHLRQPHTKSRPLAREGV